MKLDTEKFDQVADQPRRFAIFRPEATCNHGWFAGDHTAVSYNGRVPCTGMLRCALCGTQWDPDTGRAYRPEEEKP